MLARAWGGDGSCGCLENGHQETEGVPLEGRCGNMLSWRMLPLTDDPIYWPMVSFSFPATVLSMTILVIVCIMPLITWTIVCCYGCKSRKSQNPSLHRRRRQVHCFHAYSGSISVAASEARLFQSVKHESEQKTGTR